MSAGNAILLADSVGRQSADRRWILRQATLSLAAGERVAVVGPSGAGKSVLLRALARLDPLQEGEVLWHGQPVSGPHVPEYRAKVIYLRQQPAPFEGTVEELLRRPFTYAVHRGKEFSAERVVGWLARIGRDAKFLAQDAGNLSGGEAQIAALLAAMQLAPEVLLLDEPTAALDAEATEAVEQLVTGWMEEPGAGRACLWVTHNRQQAERVASRRIELREGHVMAGVG